MVTDMIYIMNEVYVRKPLFGGEVEFVVYDVDDVLVRDIVGEAYVEGLRLQKIFNFYDVDSELSKLNKFRKLEVSLELLEVLKKALEYSVLSEGVYDVSLGKFIDLRKGGEFVSPTCSYRDILIKGNLVELLHDDALIDLGSVAKGYIVDKLGDFILSLGIENFLINARGDIRVWGELVYRFGVKNPREAGEVLSIDLNARAVATSGDYNQFVGSFDRSHILNQGSFSSITVVAESLFVADIYATYLFTVSLRDFESFILTHPFVKVLAIDKKNIMKMFNDFESLVVQNEN